VEILIGATERAALEANPYKSAKVPATWIADGDTFLVSASYRGAYSLMNLMAVPNGPRNWKVKTEKIAPYRGYREWNFNQETHIRQKLAKDLYAAANVPIQPSRHVVLYVNGVRSGVYLEFPDPDNKEWLKETWGSAAGDLFKAATDIPGDTAFFGELTDLGNNDSDYFLHYQKKLNKDGADSLDYSRLRRFITWANRSSDAEFESGLAARFDVQTFIRYLVVSNFIGFWDGYPNRGKNYWLYQNPLDSVWSFLPWDVDATFETTASCLNNMGTSAGLFFMTWPRNYCGNTRETQERPLFERIMAVNAWREMYLGEYQKAMKTYLEATALLRHADSLGSLVEEDLEGLEATTFSKSQTDIRNFITSRALFVSNLLSTYPAYGPTTSAIPRTTLPHQDRSGDWIDLRGRRIPSANTHAPPPGIYWRGTEKRVIL